MENNEAMRRIENSQMLQKKQKEYVVRGALINCSNGDKQAIVNLPTDHGQYLQGSPQINVQDSKTENIGEFGNCKLTNKKCTPVLSSWLNGNEYKRIWDQNTLKAEATVIDSETYCVCMKNQGIISVVNSGQIIRNKPKDQVYITDDRTAIIMNNIRFDIYNPLNYEAPNIPTIRPLEEWFTIMEYTMSEIEFSLSKALLGIDFELEDFFREEVSVFTNQTVHYLNGKTKKDTTKIEFVKQKTPSGSDAEKAIMVAEAIDLFLGVLQSFADAVEDTHMTFYFQKANTGKRRVVLLGGTKSDYQKFLNYGFYSRERSYIHDIVSKDSSHKTKNKIGNEMKKTIKKVIIKYINRVESGTSKAKLLVDKKDMWLKNDEYYDLIVYLSPKRQYNYHQTILYSNNGKLCQEAILYPDESLAIVKRKGIYPYFDKRIKLIELKYDTCTELGSQKFWNIFDKVLKQQYLNHTKPKISVPSSATFDFANLKDEVPKGAKPKSAFDLMKS